MTFLQSLIASYLLLAGLYKTLEMIGNYFWKKSTKRNI